MRLPKPNQLVANALPGTVAANEGCRDVITGYSGTFGKRASGGTERFNNQTTQWRSKGAITVRLDGGPRTGTHARAREWASQARAPTCGPLAARPT